MLKALRWFIWYPLLLALIALALAQFWFVVHVWYWVNHNPEVTAFMQARLETMQEQDPRATIRHQWIAYERISVHLKRLRLGGHPEGPREEHQEG
jgi:monofunctional biosynthetic peptidoglycan transglycosylase